jgi:hypothetical protein
MKRQGAIMQSQSPAAVQEIERERTRTKWIYGQAVAHGVKLLPQVEHALEHKFGPEVASLDVATPRDRAKRARIERKAGH